jgi:sugar lactone lactonase YvrE
MKKSIFILIIYILLNTIILKAVNPEWIVYTSDSIDISIKHNFIHKVRIAPDNSKWITGFLNPLVIFYNICWKTFLQEQEFKVQGHSLLSISDVLFGFQNSTWLTDGGQKSLYRFSENDTLVYEYDDTTSLPRYYITGLAKSGNYLWLGSDSGLIRHDGMYEWIVYNPQNSGLHTNYISDLKADTSGNLWLGTDSGLVKYDGTNWTIWTKENSDIPGDIIGSITIDNQDNKWLTFDDNTGKICAVAKFNGTNWTVYDSTNSSLSPEGYFSSVCIDSAGVKWITTLSGIHRFDDTTWTKFDTSNSGLPHNFTSDCACDRDGNVWIATDNGLAVYREGGVILSGVEQGRGFNPMTIFFPNPAEKGGRINFNLENPLKVEIVLYNNQGKPVKSLLNDYTSPGEHTVNFNTSDLPPGTYFYKFKAGNRVETKKFVVIK